MLHIKTDLNVGVTSVVTRYRAPHSCTLC